ncbi:MAG: outer membrane beta-barrel protein [Proteobacteria bacterium]|nr:outer membrane beta-barrel protein [Pseudomonadota bacterium]
MRAICSFASGASPSCRPVTVGGISPDLLQAGSGAQPTAVPKLDITYMITENIGVESIAVVSPHDLEATGSLSALGDVATALLLPPTLTLQYHFLPNGQIHPYIGAGTNYTVMFAENAERSLENTLGPTDVSAGNSVGFAAQIGVDVDINGGWFVNLDVKYIDISTDVKLKSIGTTRTVDVDINPVIVGLGIGYRF